MNEVGLTLRRVLDDERYLQCCGEIWTVNEQYQDATTYDLSRRQQHEQLLAQATAAVAVTPDEVEKAKAALAAFEFQLDVKFAVKYHRVRGVHVTPTVFLNGVDSQLQTWIKIQVTTLSRGFDGADSAPHRLIFFPRLVV